MAVNRGRRAASVVLPCRRRVDDLWPYAAADAEPDAHVRGCRHCQDALAGLRALAAATEELAAEDVAAPDTLLDRVMRVVRSEARRGAVAPLVVGPDPATVSLAAVRSVLRYALEQRGWAVRRCRVEVPSATVGVLDVRIVLDGDDDTSVTHVRQVLEAAMTAYLGLDLREVEVERS